MNLLKLSKIAIVAANCVGLAALVQAAPGGADASRMGATQLSTRTPTGRADDRRERRQEHIEMLKERRGEHVEALHEKREEHIEQLQERSEDRADSSTTRTGTHIKN